MPLTHQRRKELHQLLRRKGRDRVRQFLVEGIRSVEAAVQAGAPLVEVFVTHEAATEPRVAAVLEAAASPVHTVSASDLARLTDVQTAQGLMAVAPSLLQEEVVLDAAHTILVLDGVQDPGNVGTLIRTAAWFGVEVVVAGPGTADLESPKVVRSAMGGLWDLHLVRAPNLAETLRHLRARLPVFGADLEGDPLAEASLPEASVLVLGSEAHGLSDDVQAQLTARVRIRAGLHDASRRGVESLNVAVAGGILLHAWLGR